MITAVVVDVAVDSDKGVATRKLSCDGDEGFDEFLNRVYVALEQLIGREPIPTPTWRAFAQELLSELVGWDENIAVNPDLLHRAREMGLDTGDAKLPDRGPSAADREALIALVDMLGTTALHPPERAIRNNAVAAIERILGERRWR